MLPRGSGAVGRASRRRLRTAPAGAGSSSARQAPRGSGRAGARARGRSSRGGAEWRQLLGGLALTGLAAALAALSAAPAVAAQPPSDAAANLAGSGKLDAALALLDTWLADHPDDPRMFPVLLQVVAAAPQQPTVDEVVARYRSRLAHDQVAVLRATPADLAELSGGVTQALQALELPGVHDASERRAALLLELGEVTPDTVPAGMPIVQAGLARSAAASGAAGLEPALRAAFNGPAARANGGAAGAVAGYGLVSLLAANGRDADAARVLEQMRSRYPRSPEYALAAAELNATADLPRVVALPSPAMLFGALVATCRPPCPPPSALLARAADRGEPSQPAATSLVNVEPVALLLTPSEPEPAAAVTALPEVELPALAVTPPATEPAAVAMKPPQVELAAVMVSPPQAIPEAGVMMAPEPEPAAGVTPRKAPRTVTFTTPAVTPAAVVPGASLAALRPLAPAAASTVTDPPVRVSSRPTRPAPATTDGTAEHITRRLSALLATTGAPTTTPAAPVTSARAAPFTTTPAVSAAPVRTWAAPPSNPVVRVTARPDPAAFIVQIGAYRDPDNALEVEEELLEAGFAALARSHAIAAGGIFHRVTVGGNMTETRAEQVLAGLRAAGFDATITRRDDVSYLPPPPPTR